MSDDLAPVTVFVALEPDATLAALIDRFKQQTRAIAGEQVYLSDPPHLTVYLAAFRELGSLLAAWPRIAARRDNLTTHLTGWHVFENDALTGNQTLVCNIAAHDKVRLRTLQREIVALLAPLHDADATRERIFPRWRFLSPEQQQCVERDGFPYLDDGWEPHFTIASIAPLDWPKIWQHLESQAPRGEFHCTRWRLYRLVDGKPAALDGFGDHA